MPKVIAPKCAWLPFSEMTSELKFPYSTALGGYFVNSQPNSDAYHVALDAATADLEHIGVQIEQLHQQREHLHKAVQALKTIVAFRDGAAAVGNDLDTAIRPVQEIDSRRAPAEPLFGGGFPAAADYGDMFQRPANGVRAAAASA